MVSYVVLFVGASLQSWHAPWVLGAGEPLRFAICRAPVERVGLELGGIVVRHGYVCALDRPLHVDRFVSCFEVGF